MKLNSTAAILGVTLGAAVSPVWGHTLTADMIEGMGNNSLFTRWRPSSHFLAPAGWMNVCSSCDEEKSVTDAN